MPGDPISNLMGEDFIGTQESVQKLKTELGLDKPLFIQYLNYWKNTLRLDLGYSYHLHVSVLKSMTTRMKWTLLLMGVSIILGTFFGTVLGAFSGWGKNNLNNKITTGFFLSLYCMPPFFLSLLFLYVFGFKLGLFPLKGLYETGTIGDILQHFFLPVLVLSLFLAARNYIIMRGSVIQERSKMYVIYAKAKGLTGTKILLRHIFKNASLPILTLVALDFGFIFSGALYIEIVFSMNGMGTLIFDALQSRDYPVLQGCFLIITLMVLAANIFADIVYGSVDPRIRGKR